MRCFKCNKLIDRKDHHFNFCEYVTGKKVRTDYCHKYCWDLIKEGLNVNREGMSMLKGMKNYLKKIGVEIDEPVVIDN